MQPPSQCERDAVAVIAETFDIVGRKALFIGALRRVQKIEKAIEADARAPDEIALRVFLDIGCRTPIGSDGGGRRWCPASAHTHLARSAHDLIQIAQSFRNIEDFRGKGLPPRESE
jgi:hypothetical protein